MATSVHCELSRDLARNPGWPLFSKASGVRTSGPSLCAVTVTWTGEATRLDSLTRRAATGLAHRVTVLAQLFDCVVVLLFVHLTRQPKSAVVLHRKIWKSVPPINVPASVERKTDVLIDCGARVRFASAALVPLSEVPWMVTAASSFEVAVPVLLPKTVGVDDATSLEWAKIAFPPDGCRESPDFEWPEFAAMVANQGGWCIRRTNDYAKGIVAVDFFGADIQAKRAAQSIVQDDDLARARYRKG